MPWHLSKQNPENIHCSLFFNLDWSFKESIFLKCWISTKCEVNYHLKTLISGNVFVCIHFQLIIIYLLRVITVVAEALMPLFQPTFLFNSVFKNN